MQLNLTQRAILNFLKDHDGQTVLMNDIAENLGITRQTVTTHIKKMTEGNIIDRDGKKFVILEE